MDQRDEGDVNGEVQLKATFQDFLWYLEATQAADRPDGPMATKDEFSTREAAAMMRDIAGDAPGAVPTPFTVTQFKEWCHQFMTIA